jgi:hypothetical protein
MKWSLLFLLLLIPALAFGGEDCSMFDGKCKDVCAENEVAEPGAFMDCTEKQECCVPKRETKKTGTPPASAPAQKENTKNK